MRLGNRTSVICLLGLGTLAASLACGLPATTGEQPQEGPQWGIDPVESAEPWTPSEEWLELYQRDQEVRDLLAQSLNEDDADLQWDLYNDYREQKNALEDYLVQNPDADAPCATLARFAPPEMWCDADDLALEANFNLT